VRHTAYGQHIGRQKVNVVASLYALTTQGASQVTPIDADFTSLSTDIVNSIQTSTLIVDASAGLECPRALSKMTGIGRAVSAFMSPDGNSAVLLAEDSASNIRLLSLEGQYYRAIINNDWGKTHLNGHLGTYWSGGSCRDISVALSYSRVLAHAACLAEQIQEVENHAGAIIRVWERTPETGAVVMFEVPAHCARVMKYGDLDVYIDQGLEAKLHEMRTEKIPCETGGILLGYYDLSAGFLVVVDAMPAPPDSISTPTSFERGTEGVLERLEEVSQLTADIVGYIGEWHSHPPGYSASPSRDDLLQLTQLALGMAQDGLPAISLIVAEGDIRIYQGQVYGKH
jgi:integrative and conjugative element protein (TIGR02256 family)